LFTLLTESSSLIGSMAVAPPPHVFQALQEWLEPTTTDSVVQQTTCLGRSSCRV